MTTTIHAGPASRVPALQPLRARRPDYARWSIEELRAFALQLQLPDARRLSREQLLAIFTAGPRD